MRCAPAPPWLPCAVLLLLLAGTGRAATADERSALALAAAALARDADPAARSAAAAVLGGVRQPALREPARAALVAALGDRSWQVRRQVAAGLIGLPAPASRVALEAALARETEREVVPTLLLALGALRDPGLVAALARWRRDPSPVVRSAAVTAVADAGGAEAREVLLATLEDPGGPDGGWTVRGAALLGLAREGRPGDVLAAQRAMDRGAGWSMWFARSALARAAPTIDPAPQALLQRLLLDADERVAVTAADALRRAAGEAALLGLLEHPLEGVRAAAAGACVQGKVVAARQRLVLLASVDASPRTRWAAALALFRLDFPEGDELVLAGLRSREPTIWAEALAVLEQRTGARHGTDLAAWRRELRRRP